MYIYQINQTKFYFIFINYFNNKTCPKIFNNNASHRHSLIENQRKGVKEQKTFYLNPSK